MSPDIRPVGASSRVNLLVHADIGWGKTTLIGSGGKLYKTLLIRPPVDHSDPIIGSGVEEVIVKDWPDMQEVLDYLRHEGDKWDWVWLDSISLFQDIGLDDVYANILDKKGPEGSTARKDRAQFGPDRGEYRVNMWRLEQFVRHTVGAGGFHFGITAHSFLFDPQDDGDPYMMPWIQGKAMPQKICGMMNIVAYGSLRTREIRGEKRTTRVLNLDKSPRWYAKNQFKKSLEASELVNPTMSAIMDPLKLVQQAAQPIRRRTRKGA